MHGVMRRAMRIGVWIILCLLAARTEAAGEKLVLVEQGQTKAAIVIQARKGRPAELAVILAAHLKQMSGATVPILTAGELGAATVKDGRIAPEPGKADPKISNYILIGESNLTRGLGLTKEGLGAGGFAIVTAGNALALFGVPDGSKSPGGDTYAVYQFLESLGCRCLWPGENGKVVPKMEAIAVGPLAVRQTPALAQRHIRFTGNDKPPLGVDAGYEALALKADAYQKIKDRAAASQAGGEWREWQGLGGDLNYTGGHDGAGLGRDGWAKYGKEHPEWFALQADGTRDQSAAKDRWRLCVSNPGLIEAVANKIIEDVKRNPATRCVSLSPNDGGTSSFCMCENCKKLDPPEAPKVKFRVFKKVGQGARSTIDYPSLTDRYVWYWNQVAERVTKVHPNLLFSIDAYSVYSTPPVREKLHPNFVLRYVPSNTDGWVGWQKAGAKRIYWRPNTLYFGSSEGTLNRFAAREIADSIGMLSHYNLIGTDMDACLDNWATMGLTYYVAAKMNWNPNLKYEEIVEDYCRAGFGRAAEVMKQFYRRVDELKDPTTKDLAPMTKYTPEAVEEMRGLMREAEQAAGDDAAVKARIAFVKRGVEFTAVTAEAMQLRNEVSAGKPLRKGEAIRVMDRRWTLMREIALKDPLAINMPYVAGNEAYIWKPLKWKGPSDKAKAAAGVMTTPAQ